MAVDIPNYRVVEKLGVGAQTRIFRARCMRTGKDYTVKIVKVIKPEDAGFIDLLRTEHAIGTVIDHPVIRKVYELRLMRRRLRVTGAILFMEYVDGMAIGDKNFKPELDEMLRVFGEAARGLGAMHQAGYVHADLKPGNILVAIDGTVKLIDLGQSSAIRAAKPRVQGTIDYMAPEQVQRGVLDERTDVFGLGAALHRALTGQPIATAMNQTINMQSQSLVGRRVDEIRQTDAKELPACVARLIEDCCQLEVEDRIADMYTIAQRIELARTILTKRANGENGFDHHDEDDDAWADEADETMDRATDTPGTTDVSDVTDTSDKPD